MSCTPTGSLAPYSSTPTTCDCGARVHAQPNGEGDWTWHDDDGRAILDTSPPGYAEYPRGWWERMKAEDIAAYSALNCRASLGMLGWWHVHRPARQVAASAPPPRCCGMPMRAIPAGWECRESGVTFAIEAEELAA